MLQLLIKCLKKLCLRNLKRTTFYCHLPHSAKARKNTIIIVIVIIRTRTTMTLTTTYSICSSFSKKSYATFFHLRVWQQQILTICTTKSHLVLHQFRNHLSNPQLFQNMGVGQQPFQLTFFKHSRVFDHLSSASAIPTLTMMIQTFIDLIFFF